MVRRSSAVGGIIAQAAKFCKPLLSKFVKACQIAGLGRLLHGGNPCNASKMAGCLWRKMEKRVLKIWEEDMERMQMEKRIDCRDIEND